MKEAPHLKEKYPELIREPVFTGVSSFEEDMILCGLYSTCKQKDYNRMFPLLAQELKAILEENGISMKREVSLRENN